jgi:hypothetical protein
MDWQFDAESTAWLNPSMTTLVIGCFLLSIIITGGTLLATRFLLSWSGWQ